MFKCLRKTVDVFMSNQAEIIKAKKEFVIAMIIEIKNIKPSTLIGIGMGFISIGLFKSYEQREW